MYSVLLLPVLSVAGSYHVGLKIEYESPWALYSLPSSRVVEVLGGGVRISLGRKQGARVGLRLDAYRLQPHPCYVAKLEIVMVGDDYSLARPIPYAFFTLAFQEDDLVRLFAPVRPDHSVRYFGVRDTYQSGGAIIDLTSTPR